MVQQGGDRKYESGDTTTVTFTDAVSEGDWVTITGDKEVSIANSNDVGRLDGVASDGYGAGEKGTVVLRGIPKANVAADTTGGTELGASTTDGEAGSGSSGYVTITDEADGLAYVKLE